jgi:hypothetical protein
MCAGWARWGSRTRHRAGRLEAVGTGRAIGFVPASVTAAMRIPPEVMAIPVIDIPPTEVCLACKADRRSEMIRDLVATALATLAAGRHEPPRGYLRMPLPRRPTSATTACPARQTRLMPSAAAPASLAAQPLGPQGRVRVHYGLVEEEMLLPGTIAELQQRRTQATAPRKRAAARSRTPTPGLPHSPGRARSVVMAG